MNAQQSLKLAHGQSPAQQKATAGCLCPVRVPLCAHVNPCPSRCRARVRGTQCCSHALRAQPDAVVCHWAGGACQPEVSCLSPSGLMCRFNPDNRCKKQLARWDPARHATRGRQALWGATELVCLCCLLWMAQPQTWWPCRQPERPLQHMLSSPARTPATSPALAHRRQSALGSVAASVGQMDIQDWLHC